MKLRVLLPTVAALMFCLAIWDWWSNHAELVVVDPGRYQILSAVPADSRVDVLYTITNSTQDILQIDVVNTSCACINVALDGHVLESGRATTARLTVATPRFGRGFGSVLLLAHGSHHEYVQLQYALEVAAFHGLVVSPKRLQLQAAEWDSGWIGTLAIRYSPEQPGDTPDKPTLVTSCTAALRSWDGWAQVDPVTWTTEVTIAVSELPVSGLADLTVGIPGNSHSALVTLERFRN